MTYEFRTDIITHVPTCCLVEDIQKLQDALNRGDLEDIGVVLECLAEVVDRYTEVPAGLDIKPSASSVVAMGCKPGIIVEHGKDLKCADGKPISLAMGGGCCQCDESCPHYQEDCSPEDGMVILNGGFVYDGTSSNESALLRFLDDSAG